MGPPHHYRNQRVCRVCHRHGKGAFGHDRPSAVCAHTAERTTLWREPKRLNSTGSQKFVVFAPMPCVMWDLCRGRIVCRVPPWRTVVANILPCVRLAFPRVQQVCRVPGWAETRQRLCMPCFGPAWHTTDLLAMADEVQPRQCPCLRAFET
jgi:hypothetical protein